MAQAEKTGKTRKKSTANTASRFYVVKTVQQARERVNGKLEEANQAYVSRPIKNGRAFVTDLQKAPRKTLGGLFDDGKELLTDLNEETRAKVGDMFKESKRFMNKAVKAPRKTLNEVWDDGKELIEEMREDARRRMEDLNNEYRSMLKGLGGDLRLVVDEVMAGGRKAVDKVPGKQTLEKEVNRWMRALPAQFNLPSKKDIDGLSRRVGTLNKKVESLQKTVAA